METATWFGGMQEGLSDIAIRSSATYHTAVGDAVLVSDDRTRSEQNPAPFVAEPDRPTALRHRPGRGRTRHRGDRTAGSVTAVGLDGQQTSVPSQEGSRTRSSGSRRLALDDGGLLPAFHCPRRRQAVGSGRRGLTTAACRSRLTAWSTWNPGTGCRRAPAVVHTNSSVSADGSSSVLPGRRPTSSTESFHRRHRTWTCAGALRNCPKQLYSFRRARSRTAVSSWPDKPEQRGRREQRTPSLYVRDRRLGRTDTVPVRVLAFSGGAPSATDSCGVLRRWPHLASREGTWEEGDVDRLTNKLREAARNRGTVLPLHPADP